MIKTEVEFKGGVGEMANNYTIKLLEEQREKLLEELRLIEKFLSIAFKSNKLRRKVGRPRKVK